jgi:hypothetical protein
MTLDKLVTSLELSKELKELGVKQDGIFYWDDRQKKVCLSNWGEPGDLGKYPLIQSFCFSAFTSGELGDILPSTIEADEGMKFDLNIWKDRVFWNVDYWWDEDTRKKSDLHFERMYDKSLAGAMAKMLIYLLKNNLITLSRGENEKDN